jgi:DNA-binding MarR family transcriptional regulator
MSDRPSNMIVEAWIALMRSQQLALLKIERAFREARLPPLAWYDALWELEKAGEGGLRPVEIERQMLLAQSNISRLIDRLERDGLVERRPCEEDGRGQYVIITRAGRDLRRRMWTVYSRAIDSAIGEKLSDSDASQLARLLKPLSMASA